MVEPKRILIFNVNWLGDVLFSTAAIRNIRYAFPESFIACVIPPRCVPVLEGNTHLNEVIVFDEQKEHKGILGKIRFLLYLRRKRFDVAYLLHRSMSRTLLAALAGIGRRIGYVTKKRAWLLTERIVPPDIRRVHRIDYYLGVLQGAGIEIKDRFTEFFVRDEDIRAVEAFLAGQGVSEDDVLIGINPGGNWGPKRWPTEAFAALAERAAQ
jgi:ADP-heptose:LPS heptosyltransferase